MRPMRRRLAVLACAGVLFLGACSGDDDPTLAGDDGQQQNADDNDNGNDGGSTSLTTGAGLDEDDPRCKQLSILLKLDVTASQRSAIEAKLDGIKQVEDFKFEKADAEDQPDAYQVTPTSTDELETIGKQFDGFDGVVTVLYPNQIC
jgi:hypothetical protein